ncbi:MAG TPA: efflux RND transporter periplasmic adaptor subunit [Methylosinus sp.]|jgi:HlyD family secretion protein|uniref:efflux RND transporter periplasmic adaptor subunit n=1 Tax=Methylosinus sp. TaxID=427 RepID=UPI002F954F1D
METKPTPNAGLKSRPARSRSTPGLRKLLLAFGLCVALGLGLWLWIAPRDASDATIYETRSLTLGTVERTISATGPVKALVTVDVGSQLSGPIAEMKADFNDRVKEGDLLAVIDRGPFEAAHASAVADLAIARAEIGLRRAAIAKTRHQLAQFERDAGRYKRLTPSGSASRMQLEHAETDIATTKDDLALAEAQLESAEGLVARREAVVRQARIDLDRTMIRSPIDGVVVDRKMQPGQTVAATYQTPILFQIAQDLSQIQIWAQVDEADIGIVRAGASASFTVEAFPEKTFTGTVDQVRLASTKTSGVITYTVIVRAENPQLELYPEMTATIRIVGAKRENVLHAPNDALRFRPPGVEASKGAQDQSRIWTLGPDGALQPRTIRAGLKGDAVTEIAEGDVHAGEMVVVRARRRPDAGKH